MYLGESDEIERNLDGFGEDFESWNLSYVVPRLAMGLRTANHGSRSCFSNIWLFCKNLVCGDITVNHRDPTTSCKANRSVLVVTKDNMWNSLEIWIAVTWSLTMG